MPNSIHEVKVRVNPNGTKQWFLNGERHRKNGPAIEHANGTKQWWLNGKLHREDGPAIIYANGISLWYKHGLKIKHPHKKQHNEKNVTIVKVNGKRYRKIKQE